MTLLTHLRTLAANGLFEALWVLPAFLRCYLKMRRILKKDRPRALLLVDFPELNLRLLKRAAQLKIPAYYIAPPQTWAWRASRAELLRAAQCVFCLYPFEIAHLRSMGLHPVFAGHPLAEAPCPPPLHPRDPSIALLPGSRLKSVQRLWPLMLEAARILAERHPQATFHVSLPPHLMPPLPNDLQLVTHPSAREALLSSQFSICGAGTVTLESALLNRPPITLARLHPLSWFLAKKLVHLPSVALPNLLLGERRYPELWGADCRPERIADEAEKSLARAQDPQWAEDLRALCKPPSPGFGAFIARHIEDARLES